MYNVAPEILWLSAGLILIASEVIAPGFVIFWFGIGSLLTALFTFIGITPGSLSQWSCFIISSLFFVILWHFYLQKRFGKNTTSVISDPTVAELKGIVTKTIEPGNPGEVKLNSSYHGLDVWKAEAGEIISEGERIVAIESSGIKLVVKKIN